MQQQQPVQIMRQCQHTATFGGARRLSAFAFGFRRLRAPTAFYFFARNREVPVQPDKEITENANALEDSGPLWLSSVAHVHRRMQADVNQQVYPRIAGHVTPIRVYPEAKQLRDPFMRSQR